MATTSSHASDNGVSSDLDAVRGDLSSLRDSIQQLLGTVMQQGKRKAADAKEAIGERAQATLDAGREKVQERPLLYVLLAFVIGMVLGRVMLARRA